MRGWSIAAMMASITVIIACFLFDGWTGKDFIRAVTPDDTSISWHDYTEEGLVANGNKMPDGTVQNPWDATDGSVEQVYAELLARVDANNSDRPSAALLAQHADDMDTRLGYNFLSRSRKSADPPNEAQKDFWHDSKYAKEVASKVVAVWEGAEKVEIVEYNDYKSAYYMIHDGFSIDGKKAPLVVARQTDNSGGHFIKFTVRDVNGEIAYLYYRLECGFQPIDPKVKVPDKPKPVKDNPDPDPGPGPGPDPGPGPGPDPDPDPEPKDPNGGYQGQHPDNPDTGGGKNKSSDEKETKDPEPEKKSPNEYKAPDPPKADDGDKGSSGKGSGDSGKKSEDKKAKDDNGKKETYTDPDSGKKSEGTVRTGHSDQYDKRDEKVDKNPSPVEKGVNPPSSNKSSDSSKKSNDSGKSSSGSEKKSNDSGKSSSGSEKKSEDSGGSNDKEIEAPE